MREIAAIAREIDRRAKPRPIGRLQELRKDLRNLARSPGHHIFSAQTTFDHYAFHFGGRAELQFNIGFDCANKKRMFRHGVAFSFETSRSLPDIDVLIPKAERFNEFLRCHPREFSDLMMWHYFNGRSRNYAPTPIPPHLVQPNVFVFLGRLQAPDQIDYELVLDDFDRLLPLYCFVEGTAAYPITTETKGQFRFKQGCRVKAATTKASVAERQLDVNLRHNEIQRALYNHLISLYGSSAVGTECATGTGCGIDVVVSRGKEYWFYEIKTAISARACIPEALAQLLDYSFWPGGQEAQRLVIVGEPVFDDEARAFVALLRKRFSLPIEYQQFDVKKGKLFDPER